MEGCNTREERIETRPGYGQRLNKYSHETHERTNSQHFAKINLGHSYNTAQFGDIALETLGNCSAHEWLACSSRWSCMAAHQGVDVTTVAPGELIADISRPVIG